MDKKDEILAFLAKKYPKIATYEEIKRAINYDGYSLHYLYMQKLINEDLVVYIKSSLIGTGYRLTEKKLFTGDIEFEIL